MIKRKYMRTRQLKPGMKLDHPVVDRLGRNLVARGVPLDDYLIDSLIKLGIMSVYIQIGEDAVKLILQRLEFLPGGSAAIGCS